MCLIIQIQTRDRGRRPVFVTVMLIKSRQNWTFYPLQENIWRSKTELCQCIWEGIKRCQLKPTFEIYKLILRLESREKKKQNVKLPIPSSHSWLLLSFRVCAVIHTFCFAVSLSAAFETLQKVFINRIYKAPTGVTRWLTGYVVVKILERLTINRI